MKIAVFALCLLFAAIVAVTVADLQAPMAGLIWPVLK